MLKHKIVGVLHRGVCQTLVSEGRMDWAGPGPEDQPRRRNALGHQQQRGRIRLIPLQRPFRKAHSQVQHSTEKRPRNLFKRLVARPGGDVLSTDTRGRDRLLGISLDGPSGGLKPGAQSRRRQRDRLSARKPRRSSTWRASPTDHGSRCRLRGVPRHPASRRSLPGHHRRPLSLQRRPGGHSERVMVPRVGSLPPHADR